ncbi:MAG: hypothetical protein QNK23_00990 [Crocinitomicaceae bacterium]|nr:hypothetical protein [Crocinitomicaceae bacterium]
MKTESMAKEIKLNSSDHFQLLFDYKIKKEKGTANTSQLLIELKGKIAREELRDYLLSNTYFKSLINTQLIRPFIGKEKYRIGEGKEIEIEEIETEVLNPSSLYQNDDVGLNPVKITLVQLPTLSAILFQFNHIFIDNNGVKNLLRSFHGEEYNFLRNEVVEQNSRWNRLKTTFQLSRKMLHKWYQSKAFIHSSSKDAIQKDYIIHTFSDEETEHIKSKIKRSHHIHSISSLLMAACCISLKKLLKNRNEDLKEYVFQQPFDMTPKKEPAYILGNRFSFIHYRLQPEGVTNLSEIEEELNRQTLQQIKDNIPHKFLDLESVLRIVSLRFHLWMISLPARGKMTSFAYSFVDETKVIDEFAGHEIANIVNIPPVMRKPPMTFGFVYYDAKLRVQVCFDKNTINKEESQLLFSSIKELLLAQE